ARRLAGCRSPQPARLHRARHQPQGNPRTFCLRLARPDRRSGSAALASQGSAPMLDIVVSGGLAVLPTSAEPADIGVSSEKIAAIGAPGSLAQLGAGRVVNAAGPIVIP